MLKFFLTSSLRFRLTLAFVILITVASTLMGVVMTRDSRRALLRMHEQTGLIHARNVARNSMAALEERDQEQLAHLLRQLEDDPSTRYATVFDASGEALAIWFRRPENVPPSGKQLGSRSGLSRLLIQNGEPMTEFLTPVRSTLEQDRTIGSVRLALSRQPLLNRIAASQDRILRLVFTAIVLGALASILMVRSFLRPITKLIRATDLIGRGEFDAVIGDLPKAGELGALSQALTRMKHALRGMRKQLMEANGQLERKVTERTLELQTALHELQGLDRLKDRFLSSISHEFRTPLTSIRAYAEILAKFQDEDPETRREFLEIIIGESDRLTRLVNDVLDLVKMESGDEGWKLDQVDILELAETALRSLRPILGEHHIKATITRRGDIPLVRGARDRLFQVISNLLSNAIKFSHEGDGVELCASAHDGCVEVSVSDHGIGVEPSEHQRIFDRFRQVGDTLTEKPRGTGLGLPICMNIIRRHGGEIWVESALNQGSSFIFTLPIEGPCDADLRGRSQPERSRKAAESETPETPKTMVS